MKPESVLEPASLPATEQASRCIVCEHRGWAPHFRLLRRCTACGFVCTRITAPIDQPHDSEGADRDRAVQRVNFAYRLQEVLALTGGMDSLFEIGCAEGLWLDQVAKLGIRCAGIDVHAEAIREARCAGLDVRCGDFLRLGIEPDEHQVFCLWDTLAHLAQPEDYLTRIYELLPAEGWLFLTTADIEALSNRTLQSTGHRQYFSRHTLRLFLERLGFRVVLIRAVPVYRNLRSILTDRRVGQPGPWNRLAAKIIPRVCQERFGLWSQRGDTLLAAARKPVSPWLAS